MNKARPLSCLSYLRFRVKSHSGGEAVPSGAIGAVIEPLAGAGIAANHFNGKDLTDLYLDGVIIVGQDIIGQRGIGKVRIGPLQPPEGPALVLL